MKIDGFIRLVKTVAKIVAETAPVLAELAAAILAATTRRKKKNR